MKTSTKNFSYSLSLFLYSSLQHSHSFLILAEKKVRDQVEAKSIFQHSEANKRIKDCNRGEKEIRTATLPFPLEDPRNPMSLKDAKITEHGLDTILPASVEGQQ